MSTPAESVEVLGPDTVALLARRYAGTGLIAELCASHERLRGLFAEASERIGKQSELLGKSAEKGIE